MDRVGFEQASFFTMLTRR